MESSFSVLSGQWPMLAGAFASVILAAFFAASETAMLFANKARLHQLAEQGNSRADAALKLSHARNNLHSSLLLIENFFLVLAVVLVTAVLLRIFAGRIPAITLATIIMCIVIVL